MSTDSNEVLGDIDRSGDALAGSNLIVDLGPGVFGQQQAGWLVTIETVDGLVQIDTGDQAAAALAALRQRTDAPFTDIVFSHGHQRYNLACREWVVDSVQTAGRIPRVIAHENVVRRQRRYLESNGLQNRLLERQFRYPAGSLDGRVFPFTTPTHTFRDRFTIETLGRTIEVLHAPSETDDAVAVWLPEDRILYGGPACIPFFPNVGSPQRPVRDPVRWADTLDRLVALPAEVLIREFGEPVRGRADIEEYLSSTAMVDQTISMITSHRSTSRRPFFAYLAFGATHAPHQAPRRYIDKYRGHYDRGWDVVRAEWFERQRELGIVPAEAELSPRNWGIPAWDELGDAQRVVYARMQEVFAGFLDHTDAEIGRLVRLLEETGEFDNTLFILLSDNGASQEGGDEGVVNELTHFNGIEVAAEEMLPHLDQLGGPHLFNNYPKGWAQVGNCPLRFYKQNTFEGGIRDPLIIHWPAGIRRRGEIRTQYHHAIDVLPTVLEAVGVVAPEKINGVRQMPVEGTSLAYCFDAPDAPSTRTTQYYEMLGHRAIYHDGWKAVTLHFPRTPYERERWNLYHVAEDFAEIHDLADQLPEKVAEMSALWWAEAERYNVLPLDDRTIELYTVRPPGSELHRNEFTFRLGTERIDRFAMPDIRNRSWSIICTFPPVAGELPEGVMVAGGARTSGYSFYLLGGGVHFAFNYLAEVTTVSIPLDPALSANAAVEVTARFIKTGDYVGTLSLEVAGTAPASAPIRMLPWRQTLFGLHIGADHGSTVTDAYPAPFRFTGTALTVRYEMQDDRDDLARAAAVEAKNAIAEQ